MLTPFRTADLTAIHLCSLDRICVACTRDLKSPSCHLGCIAFGWAESYGDILYTLALTVLNLICLGPGLAIAQSHFVA